MAPAVSVVLPTRNPDYSRLRRTLRGLQLQSLPPTDWELIVVDNASNTRLEAADFEEFLPRVRTTWRLETEIGLTPARLGGINEARGDIIVFVDDDNVLERYYLDAVLRNFRDRPSLGAAGGPIQAEWETPPPAWTREFHGLLALRDCGVEALVADGGSSVSWPNFAPVGAGLAARRDLALRYADVVKTDPMRRRLDRNGGSLASGGDNDLVFTCLRAGGQVAYLPELKLTHLIPSGRLECAYLCRLNRAIQRSWVSVLNIHGIRPWPGIPRWSLPIRALRARIRTRYWRGPAHKVRSEGLVGRLEGQADLLG